MSKNFKYDVLRLLIDLKYIAMILFMNEVIIVYVSEKMSLAEIVSYFDRL